MQIWLLFHITKLPLDKKNLLPKSPNGKYWAPALEGSRELHLPEALLSDRMTFSG